jgi:tripartite-type tricarboxylate transporter receptor subunit TctC
VNKSKLREENMTENNRRDFIKASMAGLALASLPRGAKALSAYPTQPVQIVVGFAPGGANDVMARIVADKLAPALKQSVVVINRPGAAGTIGANTVAKAKPDGHTLALASVSSLVIAASTMASVPFDVERDFAPIILLANQTIVLVVPSTLPANSVQELISLAKASPGKLNYASGGFGVANDLAGALFNEMAGVDIQHIPYNGDTGGIVAMLAGQASMMFTGLSSIKSQVEAGQLKILAVDLPRRAPMLPNVPTFAEAGMPGFEINLWLGILAPAGTSPEIVQLLNDAIDKALDQPDVAARYEQLGFNRMPTSQEAFLKQIKADHQKWPPLVKRLGRKAQ